MDMTKEELKQFAREQTKELARIINESIADPMEKRFDRLDEKFGVLA